MSINVVIKGLDATAGSTFILSNKIGINNPKIGPVATVRLSDKNTTKDISNGSWIPMTLEIR